MCPALWYFKVSLCLLVEQLADISIFVIVFIFHMACNSNCSYYCFTDINCTAFFYSCISSVIFVVSFMLVWCFDFDLSFDRCLICEMHTHRTSQILNHGTEDYMQEEMQSVKYWCTLQVWQFITRQLEHNCRWIWKCHRPTFLPRSQTWVSINIIKHENLNCQ